MIARIRRWWRARRWPRPEDLARMTDAEFDAYLERIGFASRIREALAEPRDDEASVR